MTNLSVPEWHHEFLTVSSLPPQRKRAFPRRGVSSPKGTQRVGGNNELDTVRDARKSIGLKWGRPAIPLGRCVSALRCPCWTPYTQTHLLGHRGGWGERQTNLPVSQGVENAGMTKSNKLGKAGNEFTWDFEFWVCFGGEVSNNCVSSFPATELGHVTQSFTQSSTFIL